MENVFEALQLFAEGTGESPAAEGTTGETALPAAEGVEDIDGEYAKLTGKGGKFYEAHQKATQNLINQRFAKARETELKAQRQSDLIATIAMRYPNVDETDLDALETAFINDTRFSDRKAFETGEDVEKIAKADANELELNRLKAKDKAEKARKAQEKTAMEFRSNLLAQEKEMKKTFPDFDLDKELDNPKMWEKLKRGEPLKDAYVALHYDELQKKVAVDARTATVNSIAQGSTRVNESSASKSAPAASKTDFSGMSRAEFMKIYNSR